MKEVLPHLGFLLFGFAIWAVVGLIIYLTKYHFQILENIFMYVAAIGISYITGFIVYSLIKSSRAP